MDNTFRYTNKGAVYEFDTNVLSDDEKQKFRKLNDRDKVRYIAARELEQDTTFPKSYSVQAVYNEPQNEKYNKYVIGSTKLDELKEFIGDIYDAEKIPLYLKTHDDVMEAIYNAYLKNVFPYIKNSLEGLEVSDTEKNTDNPATYLASYDHEEATEMKGKEKIPKKNQYDEQLYVLKNVKAITQKELDDILGRVYGEQITEAVLGKTPLKNIGYAYYYNVPELLKKSNHITMSDIDKLLSVKPKATFADLKNLFENDMINSNVYTSSTVSLSEALKAILKKPEMKYWKERIINPINPLLLNKLIDIYKDNVQMLHNIEDGNVKPVVDDLNETGHEAEAKEIENDVKKTAEVIKTASDLNKSDKKTKKEELPKKETDDDETEAEIVFTTDESEAEIEDDLLEGNGSKYLPIIKELFTMKPEDYYSVRAAFKLPHNIRGASHYTRWLKNDQHKDAMVVLSKIINDKLETYKLLNDESTDKMLLNDLKDIYVDVTRDWYNQNSISEVQKLIIKHFPIISELSDEERMSLYKTHGSGKGDENQYTKQIKERTEERRNENKPSPYKPEKQLGEGIGGKFLNRFKDFEPDINRLENKISNIETILSRLEEDLKKKESEVKEEETYEPEPEPEQEVPEGYIPLKPQPNSLPFSAADLSQGASNLHSFIPYVKPENEEQNDILNILKKRRQDIEPDEYEDSEEEDWGAGSKKIKLIKFINKHKLKKRFKIKDSSSSDDSSSDDEEEDD
jgi:hypothetical protein